MLRRGGGGRSPHGRLGRSFPVPFHLPVGTRLVARARIGYCKLIVSRGIVRHALDVALQRCDRFRVSARSSEGHAQGESSLEKTGVELDCFRETLDRALPGARAARDLAEHELRGRAGGIDLEL